MPLLSSREHSTRTDTFDVAEDCCLSAPLQPLWKNALRSQPIERVKPLPLRRKQRIREAILLLFGDAWVHQCEVISSLSNREWNDLLIWLDVSGLALYLADRMVELQVLNSLPPAIRRRLLQNLADNASRTQGMIQESVSLQIAFQESGLSYATLKGISLCPLAVTRPELRHQFDLDFLVSKDSIQEACKILESRGYRLYAVSGKTWEFKRDETPYVSMKDMYKDLPGRAVELHVEERSADGSSRLDRFVDRRIYGIRMPVLSPVDLFLSQAMHAFKDVCSAFSRTAHLLEFYRHVVARRDDDAFWRELKEQAEGDRRITLGLGVVTYLVTTILGDFAPESFRQWTVDVLPNNVRMWVDVYGPRTVFEQHPGTKIYLLLQRELEVAGLPGKRPIKESLLPTRLPPLIIRATADETLHALICRYRLQVRYVFSRLHFHIVEGVRYACESYRWRRLSERLTS